MEIVTLKVNGHEYLYACRKQAFIDMCKKFKGQDVEVCYSSEQDKLVSEFFEISRSGKPSLKTHRSDKEQMCLF